MAELGAEAILLPAIEVREAEDPEPLDQAIARLRTFDWVIFTSVNGVRYFMDRLDKSTRDLRALSSVKICAIGPATRAAVEALHLKVDLMPDEYVAESLVAAFTEEHLNGRRILLPRAAVARDVVPKELAKRGASVDVVEAYRTVAPAGLAEHAAEVFARKPDWITFGSSSAVKNLVSAAGPAPLTHLKIASIGPVTSATIRENGLEVEAEAAAYTMEGLVAALAGASGGG